MIRAQRICLGLAIAAACLVAGCESEPGPDAPPTADSAPAAAPPASPAPPAASAAADDDCPATAELGLICGPVNAEDLVQLGDSRWLIASGMSGESTPGRVYLVDSEARTHSEWFPGGNPRFAHDTAMFGDCPGPVDTSDFSAHGLALTATGEQSYRMYMTSHGAREAIEVFDIDASGTRPDIAWVGCVLLPERMMSNSVAIFDDGGFVTTKMMDPTAQNGFAAIMAGEISGEVYEWHPGEDVQAVPGTELSGANGIELSPDGRYMFVAAIGSREIVRYDLSADPPTQESVTIGVRPDNLRWSDAGTLYTIGGDYVPPEDCPSPPCEAGWSVIEIDPDTLDTRRVTGADADAAIQGTSTALPVGDEIWIGTFRGDRIGYMPRP